jgi:hypothetical protein
MAPLTDSPKAKRPTKPAELTKLDDYRTKLHAALTAYAANLTAKSEQADKDNLANRRDTFRTLAANATKSAAAVTRLDSVIAWQSAFNAPERIEDLVRLLVGEERLTEEHGTATDPIPYFVAAVKAKE